MSDITIPATGTGTATPNVQTDLVGGNHFQVVKIADGTVGGTAPATVDTGGNLHVAVGSVGLGMLVGASVSNLPATQPVSGYLGASVANFPATQAISGYVGASVPGGYIGASVANMTFTRTISVASSSVQVGASVSNFPATQAISGYIGASVTDWPTNQSITIASSAVTQPVSGSVAITNTPTVNIASTSITIGVSVANYPTNIGSTSSFLASANPGIYLGASISNFPVTQAVSGYLGASIANLPATQPVSGYLGASVINFPTTQAVSGYLGASLAGVASANAFNVGGSTIAFPGAAPVAGLGASPYRYISGASLNNVNVKSSAGTIYTVSAMNVNAAARYLRLFDKSTQPSPGTDLPRQTYVIPGNTAGAGAVIPNPVGLNFATGIGFDITGGSMGDADVTTTSLGDVVLNLGYS